MNITSWSAATFSATASACRTSTGRFSTQKSDTTPSEGSVSCLVLYISEVQKQRAVCRSASVSKGICVKCESSVVICHQFRNIWSNQTGYWRQSADERLGDTPPRCIQEPLVVSDRDGRPPRGPPGGALLLCVWRECTSGISPWHKRIRGMWSVSPINLS